MRRTKSDIAIASGRMLGELRREPNGPRDARLGPGLDRSRAIASILQATTADALSHCSAIAHTEAIRSCGLRRDYRGQSLPTFCAHAGGNEVVVFHRGAGSVAEVETRLLRATSSLPGVESGSGYEWSYFSEVHLES